jgi:hypothetical protein
VISVLASLALWSAPLGALGLVRPSLAAAWSLARTAFAFPMTGVCQFVSMWPFTALALGVGIVVGFGRPEARACAFLVLTGLLLNGVVPLSAEPRYFLHVLPLALALAALSPSALAGVFSGATSRGARAGLAVVLLVLLTWDQEVGAADSSILERRAGRSFSELRTAEFERWTSALSSLPPKDRLICNDDMGCLMAGRKADAWWLRSETEARLYGTRPGPSGRTSIYTGVPILVGADALLGVDDGDPRDTWIVLLDTTKYGFLEIESFVPPQAPTTLQAVCEGPGIRVFRLVSNVRPGEGRSREEVEPCPPG